MSLLEVQDLLIRFRSPDATIHAVNGVTFRLEAGERLGIVGESGSGKSVTSLAIIGLLPRPEASVEGSILFDGRELVGLPEHQARKIRGREIAMIFQDPMSSLNPVLRIEEQLIETIRAHRAVMQTSARARALELLRMVGIPDGDARLRDYPHQFSGGMRQRVMIAMALALEPRVLIADEPTTALDVTIQAQVLELLHQLTAEHGTAMILITHDLGVVARITDRVNIMYAGQLVETGSTLELFSAPSHPYTVGLLHSITGLERSERLDLVPIEGQPPDMRADPVGCPFAPRCPWRLEVCWRDRPALKAVVDQGTSNQDRPRHTGLHRIACHNPPTAEEAALGRPDSKRDRSNVESWEVASITGGSFGQDAK